MTAQAAALQIAEQGHTSDHTLRGALILLSDIAAEKCAGLSAPELEFVGHCRELAEGVRQ